MVQKVEACEEKVATEQPPAKLQAADPVIASHRHWLLVAACTQAAVPDSLSDEHHLQTPPSRVAHVAESGVGMCMWPPPSRISSEYPQSHVESAVPAHTPRFAHHVQADDAVPAKATEPAQTPRSATA
jgi:hypothetical protein